MEPLVKYETIKRQINFPKYLEPVILAMILLESGETAEDPKIFTIMKKMNFIVDNAMELLTAANISPSFNRIKFIELTMDSILVEIPEVFGYNAEDKARGTILGYLVSAQVLEISEIPTMYRNPKRILDIMDKVSCALTIMALLKTDLGPLEDVATVETDDDTEEHKKQQPVKRTAAKYGTKFKNLLRDYEEKKISAEEAGKALGLTAAGFMYRRSVYKKKLATNKAFYIQRDEEDALMKRAMDMNQQDVDRIQQETVTTLKRQ